MLKKREKVKNIVEEINDDIYLLIPNKSIGIFILGESIGKYTWNYDYILYKKDEDDEYGSDFYEFKGFEGLTIYVNNSNHIENIFADKFCYFLGYNLISYNFKKFNDLIGQKPNNEDYLPVIGIDGESIQNQHVYDFDTLGLQIWVRYNKIKTVICGSCE